MAAVPKDCTDERFKAQRGRRIWDHQLKPGVWTQGGPQVGLRKAHSGFSAHRVCRRAQRLTGILEQLSGRV